MPSACPSPVIRRLYGDGRVNLLFVGRVIPNKRIDDLIRDGAFDVILQFMRQRVHESGSRVSTRELMKRATQNTFSPDPFLRRIGHLAVANGRRD